MADAVFEVEFRGERYTRAEAGIQAYAAKLGKSLDNIVPILQTDLRWYLDQVAAAMEQRHGTEYPSGRGDKTLSRRSGDLVKSIKDSVAVSGNTLESVRGSIGSNMPYARIQEYGGTVVPKAAKYLAIPLDAALNENGTPKKRSPRDWDQTFVSRSKAGNLIIFQRQGRKVIPLYVLKDKVTIPARLGLRDTVQTGLGLFTDRVMSDMLKALKS